MHQISVGVFDEHMIFRHGVVAVLAEDPGVGEVAVATETPTSIDVAVMSPRMFRELTPNCPVVICAPRGELAALTHDESTAAAVLERESVTPDQLRCAVHAAAAGLRIETPPAPVTALDVRSREILRLLADGAGTREISEELGYSERTVKGVIQQAQRVLGARSRAQAVALALRTAVI